MPGKASTKKNLIYQMSYQILLIILPFVTSPYIARVIGAEGLGIYSYSHSVAVYFEMFALLGLLDYGNRLIAQSRDNRELLNTNFSNLYFLHLSISVLTFIVYIAYIFVFKDDSFYAILQIPYVLCTMFDISWFYFGIEDFKPTVTKNYIIKISTVALIFLLVRQRSDLWKYCLIMAFASLASTTSLWISLRKRVSFVKPSFKEMRKHIPSLLLLFVPAIALSVYKYMDKIMIGRLSNKTELGYYENADKAIAMALSVILAFGTVLLPKMTYMFAQKDNKEKALEYFYSSSELIMCVAIALGAGMAGISKVFAIVFWGEEFTDSGFLILGLAITVPFSALANIIRTQFLIPNSKDKEYTISIITGAVINLVLNWILIPKYAAAGAMVGTIGAEVSVCLMQIIFVRKELSIGKIMVKILPFFPMAGIMYVMLWLMEKNMSVSLKTLIIQVLAGMVVYCVLAVIYFIATKNEVVCTTLNKVTKKRG